MAGPTSFNSCPGQTSATPALNSGPPFLGADKPEFGTGLRAACPGNETRTIAAVRRSLTERFFQAGIETPELDARLLLQHALGLNHTVLAGASDRVLSETQRQEVAALARRRLQREPLAYIMGEQEFWSLRLQVSRATLIPRPETEILVESALALLAAAGRREQALRILDLGAGSGAILFALLHELPNATGLGIDKSADAIAIARANAARLHFATRAAFEVRDFAAPLPGTFDLVVSNPPYVTSAELQALAPDIRDYEPRLALDGGGDGLAAYRAIALSAPAAVAPGGWLLVEIGAGQERAIADIFARRGLAALGSARTDLAGIPRTLSFGRK